MSHRMRRLITVSILLCVAFATLAADNGIKLTHKPYLQNLGDDCVTIVWVASHTSVGWVEIAPDDATHFYNEERQRYYDACNGIRRESMVHSVRIAGLKPGTTYRYRVFAQEVLSHEGKRVLYGNIASTKVYKKEPLRFKTSSPDSRKVDFVVFNDIHGDVERFDQLISISEAAKSDIVLFNGDMVSVFDSEQKVFSSFMDKAASRFASQTPMYYTRGNHETRGELAYYFQRYFSPMEQHIYYAFRRGDTCFVILDTGEDKPDSDIEYAGIVEYDLYRTEQARWLAGILQSDLYTKAAHRIVVAHMPPSQDKWHGGREVEEKFMPLLRKAGVDVMLCGHTHKGSVTRPDEKTPFPIVVNSSKTAMKVSVSERGISIRSIDASGMTVQSLDLK